MGLELIVDREETGERVRISGLLWTLGEDPQLLEVQWFASGAELRVWLKAVVAEHGSKNVTVRWTDRLKADHILARLVAVCLGVAPP